MYSIINCLEGKKRGDRRHATVMANCGARSPGTENEEVQDSPDEEEEALSRSNEKWKRTSTLVTRKDMTTRSRPTKQVDQSQQTSAETPPKLLIQNEKKDKVPEEHEDLVLDPNGRWTYYWMGIVATAVLYNFGVIILRLAFKDLRDHTIYQRIFSTLDNLSDLVYLLDIAVQARTAFLEDGCLVRDPDKLLRHYRGKTTFLFDVVSILPLTTTYSLFTAALAAPIMRIGRLLKYHTLMSFFQATDSKTSNPNLLRAFKLSVYLWMVIHWIGCIYYMLSEYEGLGSNEWVYPDGDEYRQLIRKYIRCTYWSTMTLTTIGERPSPVTDLEYVFTGFTFLIGVFVFAAVVGNVGDVISNMYAARQDFQTRMDQIKFYMRHRNVPEVLQDRVKKWADYTWNRTKAIDEPSVLQLLPERLRTEIAMHVHLHTLKKVKIFEECEEGLLRELVLKLRPQIYSPGDYICRTGEIGREMYILNHGRVEILVPACVGGQKRQVAILTPGNYFGEISLLKLDDGQNRRTADVRAIGYSELLCLSRRDLLAAMVEYPNAKEILEAQAKERMMQTKGVQSPDAATRHVVTTPKRRARDVFAEVMKQEGFAKLLSARGQEMSEIQHVVADLKGLLSQVSKQSDRSSCQCDELLRRLRQKDRALKKATRRVTELETVLRIKRTSRSCSLPMSNHDSFRGKNSKDRLDSNMNGDQNGTSARAHVNDIDHNNSVMSPLARNGETPQYTDHGLVSSAARATTDHVQDNSSRKDSFSSNSSEFAELPLPLKSGIHLCNNDLYLNISNRSDETNSNGNDASSQEQIPAPFSEESFLNHIDEVLKDASLLSDSGLLLSDVSSNSDNSSVDDIDDL